MEAGVRFFLRFCACVAVVSAVAGAFAWKSRVANAQQATLPYRDASLPVEQRVADLLSRMTLEEKVAQLQGAWENKSFFSDPKMLFVDDKGNFLPENAATLLKNGIGEISRPSEHRDPRVMVEFTNSIQKGVKENTRLGSPVLLHDACLHGHVATITGYQGASYQGADPRLDKSHVMATAKHFAVHRQPESGTNVGPALYSERVIREYWLKPFEAAVKEAHVATVMPSYNEIDGIPNHSNKHLMIDVLRGEWGFTGLITSDYFGPQELRTVHHIVANQEDAARVAFESGVDVELPFNQTYGTLVDQVKAGKISESSIDASVTRMLRAKFMAGMFEDPYSNADYAEKITNSPEHQALALKAAHESIILIKNENKLLPLAKGKYKRIAVIGPNAAELHLGGYSNQPGRGVSFLQAIKTKVGSSAEVSYSLGTKITETDPDWDADKVVLGDPALNAKRIEEAAKVAAKADIVLLALGGNEQTSREAWAVNHPGDRTNLDLYGNQDDLVKAILATGKPTVVFLQHGSPNTINYLAEHVPAILDGWYLGQEGGAAVADVIFGDYNPGAKLPVTIPRSVGQLPDYYYQKPSGKREYLDSSTLPLFPFGFGLSYSTFKYSNVRATPDSIGPQGRTTVTADVTNTGSVRGDEIVQLYIRDEISSVTRPVKELRGFRRISLNPGETKTVEFTLGPDELSFLNRDMHRVVEPGTFTLMVGGNSVDVTTAKLEVVQR